jgi:hypothetical protein
LPDSASWGKYTGVKLMTIEKKYGIGVIFAATLLASILLSSVASATTENNQSDIINKY